LGIIFDVEEAETRTGKRKRKLGSGNTNMLWRRVNKNEGEREIVPLNWEA